MLKAVVEATGTCPECGAEVIKLTFGECVCPKCGSWFQNGGSKGSEYSSTSFLVESSADPISGSEPLKPSNSEHEGEVPEDPDEEGKNPSSTILRTDGCTRLGLLAPLPRFILTKHDLRRLMKEDWSPDDGLGGQRLLERPTSSTLNSPGFAGCPGPDGPSAYSLPETQRKLCECYDVETHVCREDGTAWCPNPAAPVCWTRIDLGRVKKERSKLWSRGP